MWSIDNTQSCAICGRMIVKEDVLCNRCKVADWMDSMNRAWEALRYAELEYKLSDEEEYKKDDPISFDELMES